MASDVTPTTSIKATKTLDTNAKPEKRQKNLAKAVKKMLKEYPPKPKA